MALEVINFKNKLFKFTEHWEPRVIAEMNDYQLKVVKFHRWSPSNERQEAF